ncbi:serine protease gd-like isoform X3 [Vanessa atalanta]|uniref:serine protease gd-like isoform X3 n=1 Tax=Vanessa atalanta TaxID=42275 RepID=UPI001FCD080E|nr:serine protease gd-like isoform X3 [Vanessa atalanta]
MMIIMKTFIFQIGSLLLLVIALCVPTHEQSTPNSPCPNVFMYEPTTNEPGRWYGAVNLSTDSTLHSLWLNIVLDSKADILGNWVGDVTTTDNIDFKVENTKMKIHPGPALSVRFFVQYNPLNKIPRLQAIRLNGREICNANSPQPAIDRVDTIRPDPTSSRPRLDSGLEHSQTVERPIDRPVERPIDRPIDRPLDSRPNKRPQKPIIRPEDKPETKPVYGRPSGEGPVYVAPNNRPIDQSNVNPYSIGDGQVPVQSVTERRPNHQLTTTSYRPVKQNDDDYDSVSNDPSEYFTGGYLLVTPDKTGGGSKKNSQCGKVLRNNPNPLVVNGKPTLEGQWPWQIALYHTQVVDSKYICGGTLISHKHVITAAHCVTRKGSSRPVNKNTLTIYLGKHNLRTSVEGVEIRLVSDIIVHPQYNASSFSRDASILKMRQPVEYTEFVRAACLWPEDQTDLSYVIGKKGSVVGWGFDDTGVATEELTLVEMPIVDTETCIRSYSEFFVKFTSQYTFCAGYRDGTSVCNGDSGGGMVFYMGDSWYLRGLVSLSVARQNEYRCDPTHFVVFTDLSKFLPWIKQNIE